jgi:cardiolipin synthase (CMP-forming)
VPFVIVALRDLDLHRALALVFIAGATDALDGYLARRFGWATRLGAYIDPIADKLLLVSVYIMLGVDQAIPYWLVWLVLGRDILILAMVGIAFAFTSIRQFPPSVWGKVSTIIQVLTALVVLADNGSRLATAMIYVTALTTSASGGHYAWRGITLLHAALLPRR